MMKCRSNFFLFHFSRSGRIGKRICAPRVLLATTLLCVPALHAAALRSPWNGQNVHLTDAPYSCPAVTHLAADLKTEGYYIDGKSSVVDPEKWKAYAETSGPYRKLGQTIVDAADAYGTSGSRAAAECALLHMTTAAHDGVFTGHMSSRQAYYVQGWITGAMAVAYLKIRDSGLVTDSQRKLLFPWFESIVRQTILFYEENGAKNNHLYWAGLEAIAVGVAANDRKRFDWGVQAYRVGIAQIQPDGEMPLEMRRGTRALHYHFYALAPLVYIAEFAARNGIDLYGEGDHALARLVRLCVEGWNDNTLIAKQAGAAQDTPNGPPAGDQISWAHIWVDRFHNPAVAALLAQHKSMSSLYLGGLPPGSKSEGGQ